MHWSFGYLVGFGLLAMLATIYLTPAPLPKSNGGQQESREREERRTKIQH